MEEINDFELERRMEIINKQIDVGCGNPQCEIIHCKSNPDHIELEGELRDDYVISTALEGFCECSPFRKVEGITPVEVETIDYRTSDIVKRFSNEFLSYSFRDSTQPNDPINYNSLFAFMAKVKEDGQVARDIVDFVKTKMGDRIERKNMMLFLGIPYQLRHYAMYEILYTQLMKNSSTVLISGKLPNTPNNVELVTFLSGMTNDQLKIVQQTAHDFVHEMFNRNYKKDSGEIKSLIYPLRLLRVLYEINNLRKYCHYTDFYVKAIIDDRRWRTDLFNFAEQREGLLSYPFVIDLRTRIYVLRAENKIEQDLQTINRPRMNIFEQLFPQRFCVIRVNRNNLLQSSLNQLFSKQVGELRQELRIEFEGEAGVDLGGVKSEWFMLMVKELFNIDYGMFEYNESTRQFWFNPTSEDFGDFQLIGILLGLAIYNSTILDISFPSFLFKKLLGIPLTNEDFKELDPECYTNLMNMKASKDTMDISLLGLTFSVTRRLFGQTIEIDLIPNGRDIEVTNDNIDQYIDAYCTYHCTTSIQQQFEAFKRGFSRVVTSETVMTMRPEELELVICGVKEYDFDALRKVTEYEGYDDRSQPVVYFWEIVKEMTREQHEKLLIFITSNDRVPVGGLGNMRFQIHKHGSVDRFPTASTCFNMLHLPPYKSKQVMKEKLLYAIDNATGFGLA